MLHKPNGLDTGFDIAFNFAHGLHFGLQLLPSNDALAINVDAFKFCDNGEAGVFSCAFNVWFH